MGRKKIDVVGKKFGKLLVIEDLGYVNVDGEPTTNRYVKCLCDCGNITIVCYNSLTQGYTKSCGCLKNETGGRPRKYNEYHIGIFEGNPVVYVKASNKDIDILVDIDDWEILKDTCWHITKNGYASGVYNGKLIQMQIAIIPEVPNGYERDHINRNRTDNRKCNLRVVTKLENLHNRDYKNKTSSQTGVCWYLLTKQWLAYITNQGEYITLGLFDNEEDAIAVRKQAEIDIWNKAAQWLSFLIHSIRLINQF